MDIFGQMIAKIIKEQENIIGPLALEQAQKVPGLKLEWEKGEVVLNGDEKKILESLVNKYKELFGQASIEVCKEAVHTLISQTSSDNIPAVLR